MDAIKWQESQYIVLMQLFIIKLVGLLGWLSSIAVAQLELSETVTGSASFPDLGITCLGNLAIFFTSLYRGRLDMEIGARDVLATLTGPKLENINGIGLTTCRGDLKATSVVMLCTGMPNSSIRLFMKYISNAHEVESILLQCVPLVSAAVIAENCECNDVTCGCIVFCTRKEITVMLARQMPGILKQLSDSLCLLPSLNCLRQSCHGCNQGLLHADTDEFGREILTEGDSEESHIVCDTFPEFIEENRICICIPIEAGDRGDHWTNMLIKSLMLKEKEARGVTIEASDSQETSQVIVEYSNATLVVPRLIEVLVNLLLTGWFRIDGFSSSLIARRALRGYVVNTTGTGFGANAFLTKARIKSDVNNTNVCQVLKFRGSYLTIRTLSLMVGCGNIFCSISWAVLIALEGSAGKWYDSHSMPPSKPRVAVIMAAISASLVMDCLDLFVFSKRISGRRNLVVGISGRVLFAVMVMEIVCIVSGSAVAGIWGTKGFGRWVYSALLALVWMKWGIGSYLLGEFSQEFDSRPQRWDAEDISVMSSSRSRSGIGRGVLVYSSAFLLNAILAGVRGKWKYVSKDESQ